MEYNKNENAEIAFSRLDQEQLVPKPKIFHAAHRGSQVLLVVLCFAQLFALIALSVLYAEKSNLTDSLEAKNRNLSAYLAAQQTEDVRKGDMIDSLKATIWNLSVMLAEPQEEKDGDAWTRHLGQSYYFSTWKLNWTESRNYCAAMGAQLVIIKSEETQDFLRGRIRETHWIGLSDVGTEGKWCWVDDTPLSPTEKHFWHQRKDGDHEPDNWFGAGDPNGEDCAAMGDEYGGLWAWFDATSKKRKKFICEK